VSTSSFNFMSGLYSQKAFRSVAVARKSCMSCNHAWLSVNETSKPDTATIFFVLLKDYCVLFVRFCGRASTARHEQAGLVTPDCLPGSTSSCNFALLSIQGFTCLHPIINVRFVCFRGICSRARHGQPLSGRSTSSTCNRQQMRQRARFHGDLRS
jgi:hypothetical protein